MALFFHDSYGGTEIGVLFKPDFTSNFDFKVKYPSFIILKIYCNYTIHSIQLFLFLCIYFIGCKYKW